MYLNFIWLQRTMNHRLFAGWTAAGDVLQRFVLTDFDFADALQIWRRFVERFRHL